MRREGVLFTIADSVRRDLEARRAAVSEAALLAGLADTRDPRDFTLPFRRGEGIQVIAEVKLASPSAGQIAPGADPVAVGGAYLDAGAAAISVLTERAYFGGSPENLRRIRAAHSQALLLKKDFIVHEYQLLEARYEGADAVLLIVALLGAKRLAELQTFALDLGLTPLIEVHDEQELEAAALAGAGLIGVNNRDLKSLKVSLDVSRRLARLAPRDSILISESGITAGEELAELERLGFRGALIGSSLMATGAPGDALARLVGRAS